MSAPLTSKINSALLAVLLLGLGGTSGVFYRQLDAIQADQKDLKSSMTPKAEYAIQLKSLEVQILDVKTDLERLKAENKSAEATTTAMLMDLRLRMVKVERDQEFLMNRK